MDRREPPPEDAHQAALDLLSRREHSRRDLARKLRRKGYPREEIERMLQRLEEVGLVSDERFARLFVRDRLTVNPQGRRRLVGGLRVKGIAPEVAAAAVGEVYDERGLSDRELALSLASRRLASLSKLDPPVAKRRLAGYLARRGFDSAIVAEVVQIVLSKGHGEVCGPNGSLLEGSKEPIEP
jgi:regulatory protein